MKPLFETPEAAQCSEAMEEALNLYMDGELPFGEQPLLFAHLATCDQCRRIMGSMLEFRRMSRQETFVVPPAIDDAIFKRLHQVKKRSKRVDRYWDRRPLWQARTPVSLRAAALAAVMLFGAGLMFPQEAGEPVTEVPVSLHEEHVVDYGPFERPEVHILLYPGLTVEASRIIETNISDTY